jgi:ABC-type transporter Mla subunit MlaD
MKHVLLLSLLLTGCATAPDTARQAVTTAIDILSTGNDVLSKYDHDKEQAIIDKMHQTGDIDEAKKELADWRAQRDKISKALQDVWNAITVAAKAVPLVERGVSKSSDLTGWVNDIWTEVGALIKAMQDAGVPLGPLAAAQGVGK